MTRSITKNKLAYSLSTVLVLATCLFLVYFLPSAQREFLGLRNIGPACTDSPGGRLDSSTEDLPDTAKHPLLIYQHVPTHLSQSQRIYNVSVDGHRRYADAHGYRYKGDWGEYIKGENIGMAQSNKAYSVMKVILEQLALGTLGAEWLFVTDGDTLITDPRVAIHTLLPPSDLSPSPLILGNRDPYGFNSGVLLLRVCPEVAQVYAMMLALSVSHDTLSDQGLLVLVLQDNVAFSSRFYEIPMRWFNLYPGEEYEKGGQLEGFGRAPGDIWTPQLQYHLVNYIKHQMGPERFEEQEERVYAAARDLAETDGVSGDGLELGDVAAMTQEAGDRYWKSAKSGIEDMTWNVV